MASSQEAVIQDLLFRLVSVYTDRLTNADAQSSSLQTSSRRRQLRNAEDLVQWLKNLHFYLGSLIRLSSSHLELPCLCFR